MSKHEVSIQFLKSHTATLYQAERHARQEGRIIDAEKIVAERSEYLDAIGLLESVNQAPITAPAVVFAPIPVEDPETRAGRLYDAYSAAVGGKAFNGDPLPSWDDFSTDPEKEKQANAWRTVALATYPAGPIDEPSAE